MSIWDMRQWWESLLPWWVPFVVPMLCLFLVLGAFAHDWAIGKFKR